MTSYRVDSDAVMGTTAGMRASMARIQAEIAGLHSQLINLESSWSGPAATAFQAVVADWRATEQRVDESLTSLNQALAAAAQQYADIEQANARLFGR